jgi:hypothetical protein
MPEEQDSSLEYIQQEVRKYHEAFRQEFEALNSNDIHAIKEKVKERFSNNLLSFVDTIIELARDSESESTRLTAAKFGLNFVLGDVVEKPEDDPLNQLIAGLMKKEAKRHKRASAESRELAADLEVQEYDNLLQTEDE